MMNKSDVYVNNLNMGIYFDLCVNATAADKGLYKIQLKNFFSFVTHVLFLELEKYTK